MFCCYTPTFFFGGGEEGGGGVGGWFPLEPLEFSHSV